LDLKRIMFKILDRDNNTEEGHMRSGKVFQGAYLESLFNKNYREEGFYSGEEVDLTEYSTRTPTKPTSIIDI
jgi:hypothetical protein